MKEEELHLYLEIDSKLATSEELTDAAIITQVKGALLKDDEEEEEETTADPPTKTPIPTLSAAMASLNVLRLFFQENNMETDIQDLLKIEQSVQETSKQKSIKDFFV